MQESPFFPYQHLGLQCNPFRALTLQEWGEVALIPAEAAEAQSGDSCIQILGDEGSGKTSCLLAMLHMDQSAGRQAVYEYIKPGVDRFQADLTGLGVIYLDEVQRLRSLEIRRLLRAIRKLPVRAIVGSHRDLNASFSRSGVSLTTIELKPGHESAETILNRRLAFFSLDGTTQYRFSTDAVDYLLDRFDSYRTITMFLYEYFCTLPLPGVITSDDLSCFSALEAAG